MVQTPSFWLCLPNEVFEIGKLVPPQRTSYMPEIPARPKIRVSRAKIDGQ
jgi:hypothetical protein